MKEFMEKWEKENNPFYPNEMRWDKVKINQMLSAYEQQKQTSDNSDYAMAVKKFIKSDVDCVQTKNGAYVNLDGVFDCLNRAL